MDMTLTLNKEPAASVWPCGHPKLPFLQVFQSWGVSVHCCVQSGNAHMTETPVKRESRVDSQTTERPKAAVVNRELKKLVELNSCSVN